MISLLLVGNLGYNSSYSFKKVTLSFIKTLYPSRSASPKWYTISATYETYIILLLRLSLRCKPSIAI